MSCSPPQGQASHPGSYLNVDVVEVKVGGEVIGHVGQHHRVLEHGEHRVHA